MFQTSFGNWYKAVATPCKNREHCIFFWMFCKAQKSRLKSFFCISETETSGAIQQSLRQHFLEKKKAETIILCLALFSSYCVDVLCTMLVQLSTTVAATCRHVESFLKRALHETGRGGKQSQSEERNWRQIKSWKTGSTGTSERISAFLGRFRRRGGPLPIAGRPWANIQNLNCSQIRRLLL